ncbi:hypothetical protein CAPTEDRAFT_212418 [Capitella teleta]|uniref:Uncharacterized protein n=1 Tax=Capitella teleta TaxID=283909 RepID=R7U7S6_CAPTE|nr:hypothetical protein CAPTEDRAFT_212418 [Capitella teleta]|eukprot:ELU02206.1 hypothetical protein CAPTEDRAFT_212418 [Capitella teleta]
MPKLQLIRSDISTMTEILVRKRRPRQHTLRVLYGKLLNLTQLRAKTNILKASCTASKGSISGYFPTLHCYIKGQEGKHVSIFHYLGSQCQMFRTPVRGQWAEVVDHHYCVRVWQGTTKRLPKYINSYIGIQNTSRPCLRFKDVCKRHIRTAGINSSNWKGLFGKRPKRAEKSSEERLQTRPGRRMMQQLEEEKAAQESRSDPTTIENKGNTKYKIIMCYTLWWIRAAQHSWFHFIKCCGVFKRWVLQ